ncbi:hypothetical protein CEE69_01235 [Rhodopirellula bahusiensis]|uniref:DUF1990 domain-containing protein n=1 Tax=Rhodopirellula bahusiensis TaxID=2014065 RepID=A0A2G1WDA6_9BACT|nr:hypothetical protein CEE69_01235 [Rhodopirellula bahusiensis]
MVAYKFPDPGRVVGYFDASSELNGQTMLLQAKFLWMSFVFGVRVSQVLDERRVEDVGGYRKRFGYAYRTLQGHWEIEWVKQWLGYPSHHLPVVATGSIPCIYRRAAFPHRATPGSLPRATLVRQGPASPMRSHACVLLMDVPVKSRSFSSPSFLSKCLIFSR